MLEQELGLVDPVLAHVEAVALAGPISLAQKV